MSHEFSEASAIYRPVGFSAGDGLLLAPSPAAHRLDESQPTIPRRVGLHRSPLPLHRLRSECSTVVLPVEQFAANGNSVLFGCLSRGVHPTNGRLITHPTSCQEGLGVRLPRTGVWSICKCATSHRKVAPIKSGTSLATLIEALERLTS